MILNLASELKAQAEAMKLAGANELRMALSGLVTGDADDIREFATAVMAAAIDAGLSGDAKRIAGVRAEARALLEASRVRVTRAAKPGLQRLLDGFLAGVQAILAVLVRTAIVSAFG